MRDNLAIKQTKQGVTGYPSIDKPWLKHYSEEEYNEEIPQCSIYDLIYNRNKNRMRETALIYFGKKISYEELFSETERVGKSLIQIGVKKGEIVNLLMAATPEAVYTVLACSRIGALANFINPLFSEQQIVDRINDTKSSFLLVLDKMLPLVEKVIERTSIRKVIVVPISASMPIHLKVLMGLRNGTKHRYIKWEDFLALGKKNKLPYGAYIPNTPVVMVYSSGTTGASKGIVLSNEGIVATCVMEKYSLPLMVESSFLAIIPIWFSTGISCSILVPLANGGTVILEPQYSEKNFTRDIVKWKPQGIIGTSSLWEGAMAGIGKANLSFLKCAISGGEPISSAFEDRINHFFTEHGCEKTLIKGYGQCEVGGTATLSKDSIKSFGDVGIPLSHVCISAFDMDTDQEVKTGEVGEIRVLSPARMNGYFNRSEETQKKLFVDDLGETWVCTGDAGLVRKDGNVVILGRMSDSFVTAKGIRVFLFRIKNTVLESGCVTRCEVVRISEVASKPIVANIVLRDDIDSCEALNIIHRTCMEKLEPYEIPDLYKIRDSFELNSTSGKIDVEALKRERDGFVDSENRYVEIE